MNNNSIRYIFRIIAVTAIAAVMVLFGCGHDFDNAADPKNSGGFYGGIADTLLWGSWDWIGTTTDTGFAPALLMENRLLFTEQAMEYYGVGLSNDSVLKINARTGQIFMYASGMKTPGYLYDYRFSSDGDTLIIVADVSDTLQRLSYFSPGSFGVFLRHKGPVDTHHVTISTSIDSTLFGSWTFLDNGVPAQDDYFVISADGILLGGSTILDTVEHPDQRLQASAGQIAAKGLDTGTNTVVTAYMFDYQIAAGGAQAPDTLYWIAEGTGTAIRPTRLTPEVIICVRGSQGALGYSLLGSWDEYTGLQARSAYVKIFKDSIVVNGVQWSVCTGGRLVSSVDQIFCVTGSDTAWWFDYNIETPVLYLLPDSTQTPHQIDYQTPGVMILSKDSLRIEPALWGVWDEWSYSSKTLVADSQYVFSPSLFIWDGDTMCNQDVHAQGGQIWCTGRGIPYIKDYTLNPGADTMFIINDTYSSYSHPTSANIPIAEYVIKRK